MLTGKDGVRELIVREMTPEFREQLRKFVRRESYVKDVENLATAAQIWLTLHPGAVLEWNEIGRELVSGDLGDPYVQGYLAKSEHAFALLRFMDEKTYGVGTLMQARFALQYLGVVP